MTRIDHDTSSQQTGTRERPTRRKSLARRFSIVPLLVLGGLILGGCKLPTFGAFRGATKQGQTEFTLWSWTFMAGLVVAVIVWGLIFWAIVRYRRRGDAIPRQFNKNIPIEVIYTTIPVIIVAFLFYATVIAENRIDAVSPHPAEIINVTAYRWGWRFAYVSGAGKSQHVLIQTAGQPKVLAQPATSPQYPQLVLPNDSTVRIDLRSADVVHEMYVPEFNFGRYAQPGYANLFDFTTTTTGTFRGQCAEYCGLYHAEMLFTVKVVPPKVFSSWLASKRS